MDEFLEKQVENTQHTLSKARASKEEKESEELLKEAYDQVTQIMKYLGEHEKIGKEQIKKFLKQDFETAIFDQKEYVRKEKLDEAINKHLR